MSRPVTLKMVYREVKIIKQILEELAERSLVNVIPEEEISREEWRELQATEVELKKGEYIPLEEAEKKLKAR